MLEVPATEVAKRFSQYRQAAQHEPVAVTHHSRVTEVLMSKRDYDEYVRLKSLATRAFWVHELSRPSRRWRKRAWIRVMIISTRSWMNRRDGHSRS
jgi:hypothetical protein